MKYTSFNYSTSFIVLLVILGFGVFEGLSANWTIATYLTLPLLPLVFFFKNTYQIKKDYLAVSTFGKIHQKIWLKDIEKIEVGKNFWGRREAKIFYSPYDFVSVKLGEKTEDFIQELNLVVVNEKN